MTTDIEELLGDEAESLLSHQCKGVTVDELSLPGPDYIERVVVASDRPIPVVRNLAALYAHGRLGGTGYLSILPVDQGIEHSAAASFSKNPAYFYPDRYDQVMFGSVRQAAGLGALGVGATIYFGSDESDRQLSEVRTAFEQAHDLGLFTVLWCYLRNAAFKTPDADYHVAADLTGQANHIGVTIEADLIKQKQPENNAGYQALSFGRTDPLVYDQLTTDNPIDMTRWQVLNCYAGRVGLINSGGESKGSGDLAQAVRTAVINKRAGGTGLIVGRKAFQRPMAEGVGLLHAVQDVFLDDSITIA